MIIIIRVRLRRSSSIGARLDPARRWYGYGRYKDFVLAGGREHSLPPEYIAEYIESVEAIEDPNKTRDKKQWATLGSPGRCDLAVRTAGLISASTLLEHRSAPASASVLKANRSREFISNHRERDRKVVDPRRRIRREPPRRHGFPRYRDKSSNLSATLNKFLLENGLRPTEDHTVYSLRHSFKTV